MKKILFLILIFMILCGCSSKVEISYEEDMIGVWTNEVRIDGGWYISMIYIYGDGRCGLTADLVGNKVIPLGGYTDCSYVVSENQFEMIETETLYVYNEENDTFINSENGAVYSRVTHDPCSLTTSRC